MGTPDSERSTASSTDDAQYAHSEALFGIARQKHWWGPVDDDAIAEACSRLKRRVGEGQWARDRYERQTTRHGTPVPSTGETPELACDSAELAVSKF